MKQLLLLLFSGAGLGALLHLALAHTPSALPIKPKVVPKVVFKQNADLVGSLDDIRYGAPVAALNRIASMIAGRDPQTKRALRAVALEQMKDWLESDADQAVIWLAREGSHLPGALRRQLADAAAKIAPQKLLESCVLAGEPASLLDFLSSALGGELEQTPEQLAKLFETTAQRFPQAREQVRSTWIFEMAASKPEELLALSEMQTERDLARNMKSEALPRIAEKDFGKALAVIEATPADFTNNTIAHTLSYTRAEEAESLFKFLERSGEAKAEFAHRSAFQAAGSWPEEKKADFLEWGIAQDEATLQAVATGLIPHMKSFETSAVQSLCDQLLFDNEVQRSIGEAMSNRGDIDSWIKWINGKGGMTAESARLAEAYMEMNRPVDLRLWKEQQKGRSLSRDLVK